MSQTNSEFGEDIKFVLPCFVGHLVQCTTLHPYSIIGIFKYIPFSYTSRYSPFRILSTIPIPSTKVYPGVLSLDIWPPPPS